MATTFTIADFEALGVCDGGLTRVAEFGGSITNTAEGWGAYVEMFPEAWRAPLFTAMRLKKRKGWAIDPDLIWKIARIAFREAATIERLRHLGQYAESLNQDNWREARDAAYVVGAAYVGGAAAAYAADYAAAAYAAYADAADAACAAADAADAYADAASKRVRAEIVALSIAALVAADKA
jgi:hypothetical protein